MSRSRPPRLADIAERLDLSVMAVSKALRDHSDISEDAKARVRSVADELGYVPNRQARALKTKRSMSLGVVVPKISHLFYAEALHGIQETASKRGYEIVLCISDEDPELERKHLETLLAIQVDGFLVAVAEQPAPRSIYQRLRKAGKPVVFFDRCFDRHGSSSVTMDDRQAARDLTAHLVSLGHRRIAHLAAFDSLNVGRARRQGFEDAMKEAGLEIRKSWIVEGGFSEENGTRGYQKLGRVKGASPDAIVAVSYPVGLGAVRAMLDEGKNAADRTQVAVFGQAAMNPFLKYPFVCIEQPIREMGRRAVEVALQELDAPPKTPTRIVLPAQPAWES